MKGLLRDGSRVVIIESFIFDLSINRVQEEGEIGDVATCKLRFRNSVLEVFLEDIQNNRLVIEEIKNLFRFENYVLGEFSKVCLCFQFFDICLCFKKKYKYFCVWYGLKY